MDGETIAGVLMVFAFVYVMALLLGFAAQYDGGNDD